MMCDSDTEYDYPDNEPTVSWIYHYHRSEYKPLSVLINKQHYCIRKKKQENGKYKKCKKRLFRCCGCYQNLCSSLDCIHHYLIRGHDEGRPHALCKDCTTITCSRRGVCETCEKNHLYDMITERVAIGSYQAPYQPFDVIVNLDYPENKVKKGEIKYAIENNKHVIRCGLEDDWAEHIENGICRLSSPLTHLMLEKVYKMITDIHDKPTILFHCYLGVSRSSTFAIYYLSKQEGKTTTEIYQLAKQIRPRIQPNPHFAELLELPD